MDVEFMNPFIESMSNILTTMAAMECTPGKVHVKKGKNAGGHVTGIIGMAGEEVKGSFAVSFTEPVILAITEKMLGEKTTKIDEIVTDMVGEITNMATGGAKKLLADKGFGFNMATPVVVSGELHNVDHFSNGPTIVIPFTTQVGEFYIEMSFAPAS